MCGSGAGKKASGTSALALYRGLCYKLTTGIEALP